MMRAFSCPSCGAALEMKSSIAVFAVCTSCGSMVVRTDAAVESIGKAASLPDDLTPLQVGAGFAWEGRRYTILGRARIGWKDGAWNEWFADDGRRPAWLAEAQGFLSIAFEQPLPAGLDGPMPPLGAALSIGGATFRVADVKEAVCIGSEGELPFAAPKGRAATYADMLSETEAFAGLEDSAEGRRLYVGHYAPFRAFGLTGLRALDGWTPPATQTRSSDPRYDGRR